MVDGWTPSPFITLFCWYTTKPFYYLINVVLEPLQFSSTGHLYRKLASCRSTILSKYLRRR
uniref:Uncharacterized protein n=1 Tax=Zea mays TaxID=4577 RepID=B6SGJ0_MAIZE|nr:hypothetical protein [Zea mays]